VRPREKGTRDDGWAARPHQGSKKSLSKKSSKRNVKQKKKTGSTALERIKEATRAFQKG
jgi:hypothetical protein